MVRERGLAIPIAYATYNHQQPVTTTTTTTTTQE